MERYIVDRIEGEYIVLEKDTTMINIKKDKIEFEVKEGDILLIDGNGKYILDKNTTMSRKEEIECITKDLWEN